MKNIQALYDIQQSFEENVTYGPQWSAPYPELHVPKVKPTVLGKSVDSLFGAAASPLTASKKHLLLLEKLGYSVLTYKTVRSVEWRGNRFPHWVPVKLNAALGTPECEAEVADDLPTSSQLSMANSFGVHSVGPDLWQDDVKVTLQSLKNTTQLIVSVMPTPQPNQTLVDDMKVLAKLVRETGATVVELNLACPNTETGHGLLYQDVTLSTQLLAATKEQLGDAKLLVKIGPMNTVSELRTFMQETASVCDGVTTTNTASTTVKTSDGNEYFPGRPTAGISGDGIRVLAMQQAAQAVALRTELELQNYTVIGVGGVMRVEHIQEYLRLGVDAVQAAVGIWADPLLGYKYRETVK